MKLISVILLGLLVCAAFGQTREAEKWIRSGNEFYKQGQFEQATAEYNKALAADPSNTTAKFNLASALYKLNKRDEAIKAFSSLSTADNEKNLRSQSYYNTGAIQSRQQKLEESIESYKSALRLNPDDKEARENLQKALLELKKKNNPKQNQDKQKQQNKSQSKMSPKEAEQRLKLLEQKEKEVQERMQKEKSKSGGGGRKDW